MIHGADVIRIVRHNYEPPGLRKPAETKDEALGAAFGMWSAAWMTAAGIVVIVVLVKLTMLALRLMGW
jgi:hypothetical protein